MSPFPRRRVFAVLARSASTPIGLMKVGNLFFRCALGRAGCVTRKREGDGATPRGILPVRGVFYRRDRVPRPRTALPTRAIQPNLGWCDASGDRNYNRIVTLPYEASAERLARADRLYDIVVVLGYNDYPRKRGLGSAIFLHVAQPNFAPTEGCVALRRADLTRLLAHLSPGDRIRVLR
jgi:L,D-peptidoglycan transpeptidase YkuD (ErfK/YbiS/YcfS/YnhG family)